MRNIILTLAVTLVFISCNSSSITAPNSTDTLSTTSTTIEGNQITHIRHKTQILEIPDIGLCLCECIASPQAVEIEWLEVCYSENDCQTQCGNYCKNYSSAGGDVGEWIVNYSECAFMDDPTFP